MSEQLHERIGRYLRQLAPHQRDRQAAQLLQEAERALRENSATQDKPGVVELCEMQNAIREPTGGEEEPVKHYAHYLGVTQFIELRFALAIVKGIFHDSFGIYLVGSALTKKDWRDVDVRHVIGDEEFQQRFGDFVEPYERNHFLRAFNLGVSAAMRAYCGLPVDYQVQPITKANELYPIESNPRNGLGLI